MKQIILAGGCFWGVEAYYKQLKGIINTEVGYTDGFLENPTYQDLVNHRTDHVEAVLLEYDENIISLTKILEHLFRFIDPTSKYKQGGDIGIQYRTGVYYNELEEKKEIEKFINLKQVEYEDDIVVEVKLQSTFWKAEEYHQDYLDKNPKGYCHVDLGLVKEGEKK